MKHLTRRSAIKIGAAFALTGIAAPAIAQKRQRITIVTGGTGGVYYPYGGGLAKILSERVPNMQATAQVTGGSVDNVKLLHTGEAEIGFATIDSAYDGLMGTGAYAKDGKQNIRTIAWIYDSYVHIVASQSSKVTTVAGLKGHRVGVGSPGSSTEGMADRVLEAAGLDPRKDITRDNLSVAESANALKDGKIAAFFWGGGVPTAAVRDLATTGQSPIRFLPITSELGELEKKYTGQYRPFVLQKGSYPGQPDDVAGLGLANLMLIPAKASDEVVTAILNGIFGSIEEVNKIHPEARKLNLKDAATRTAVPFHPAAEAFYRAKGVLQ